MGAVVDDEDSVFGEKPFHQNVEAGRINPAISHECQMFGAQLGVLREGLIHGIAVNTMDLLAVMAKVLSENAGDQALSDATVALQCEVDRGWVSGHSSFHEFDCLQPLREWRALFGTQNFFERCPM